MILPDVEDKFVVSHRDFGLHCVLLHGDFETDLQCRRELLEQANTEVVGWVTLHAQDGLGTDSCALREVGAAKSECSPSGRDSFSDVFHVFFILRCGVRLYDGVAGSIFASAVNADCTLPPFIPFFGSA